MSWIYTLFVASLFMSGDTGTAIKNNVSAETQPAAVRSADETEKLDKTYPISANGRVSVSNINGSIIVEAWDRNEVHLEATKIADSKEGLDDVDIVVESSGDSFEVRTDYKEWKWRDRTEKDRHRKLEVQFKLSVPRTAQLNEIETVNGSVQVGDFTNFTKVSAVNGDVSAGNLRGAANLSTVNGEVSVDFDRLEQGSKINLSTVNGSVKLSIPSDANATIKADSLNGEISNDFGLPVRKGQYVGRDLYGKVGSGEVQIKLNSVNGPLSISRKKDGKSVNPATNLLPTKREGENWDDSEDFELDKTSMARMNRDVARATREANRAVEMASEETAKVLKNVDFAKLSDLKIKIDEKALERSVKDGLRAQSIAMSRLRDAMWLNGSPMIERKTNTIPLSGKAKITIDARGCNVKVRGWDRPEVKYVLTEVSGRPEAKPADVEEIKSGDGLSIKVITHNDDRNWMGEDNSGSRIEVWVPRKADLKIMSDLEIRLDGVSGQIELIGEEGSIDVRSSDGSLKVANTDGKVRVVDFKGDLSVDTVDGEYFLDGDFTKIDGKANDARFVLTLPGNAGAEIRANSGNVEFEELPSNKQLSETTWKLGDGSRKYTFNGGESSIHIQNRENVTQ